MTTPHRAPEQYRQYAEWMRRALTAAETALSTGDVPIGAVVVDAAGEVIGSAANRREADNDPTAHAEVLALRQAAARRGEWRLHEASLVVSLEPCTMCAGAAVLAQVNRVIFGAFDPKAGAVGSLYDVIRDPRHNVVVQVYGGVLEAESGELLRQFFRQQRQG